MGSTTVPDEAASVGGVARVTLWRCEVCQRPFSVVPPQTEDESRAKHYEERTECADGRRSVLRPEQAWNHRPGE